VFTATIRDPPLQPLRMPSVVITRPLRHAQSLSQLRSQQQPGGASVSSPDQGVTPPMKRALSSFELGPPQRQQQQHPGSGAAAAAAALTRFSLMASGPEVPLMVEVGAGAVPPAVRGARRSRGHQGHRPKQQHGGAS
jgi:hypothetical protein